MIYRLKYDYQEWKYPGLHSASSLPKIKEQLSRVLARISKMPVQNSNFKISACLDWATNLLQILIPTIFNSLMCQNGQFTLELCPRRWFVSKILGFYPPKVKIKRYS